MTAVDPVVALRDAARRAGLACTSSGNLRVAMLPADYLVAAADEIKRLRAERDEARRQTGRILNEIDCRIEHGAESNGHLEAIYNLFKENSNV